MEGTEQRLQTQVWKVLGCDLQPGGWAWGRGQKRRRQFAFLGGDPLGHPWENQCSAGRPAQGRNVIFYFLREAKDPGFFLVCPHFYIFTTYRFFFFKFCENPICPLSDHFPIFVTETHKMILFLLLALFCYFQISHLELNAVLPDSLPLLPSSLC